MEYLACKTFGHSWQIFGAIEVDGRLDKMVLDCFRCHTRRIDFVNSRGEVVKRKRRVPKNYYALPGSGSTRAGYRKIIIDERKARKQRGR